MIVTPIVERLIENEKRKRLALLFPSEPEEDQPIIEEEPTSEIVPPVIHVALSPRYATKGQLREIGTGVLNEHYQVGETVDIHSLKQKKLIGRGCKRIKIIENGNLDKALTVHVDSCSKKAREAILKAGGSIEIKAHSVSNPSSDSPAEY